MQATALQLVDNVVPAVPTRQWVLGLMHLCGYGARPPLTQERLSSRPDGKLAYRLKRPLADGSDSLVLEPRELLRRLATLVPPPRAHLVRYHREDVLACPCGGRRVVTAFITEKKVIEQILGHLGIPATGPPIAPARSWAAPDCPGWQDDVPELQQALR
jgi:hypothetical protein